MARIYSTGPALIYAGVNDAPGVVPVFIGTCQSAPEIDIQPSFHHVMNDLGGNQKPFDRMWEGEEGMVSGVLNRFNYLTLLRMMSRPRTNTATPGTAGINISGDVGTLMGQEGLTYHLWVAFPKGGTLPYPDLVPGYHFYAAMLLGPDKIQPGTKDLGVHCIWQCQRQFNPAGAGLGIPTTGSLTLYDTLTTSFASLPPIN